MAKIYNEIVIDMNPESSTFEETLYEDSFEYSGDMMLAENGDDAGKTVWVKKGEDRYERWMVTDTGYWSMGGGTYKTNAELAGNEVIVESAPSGQAIDDMSYDNIVSGGGTGEGVISGQYTESSGADPFSGQNVYYKQPDGSWNRYSWSPEEGKFSSIGQNVSWGDIPEGAIRYYTQADFNEATGATSEGGKMYYTKAPSKYDPDDPGTEGLPPMTNERWNEMDLTGKAQYILDTKYQGDVPNMGNDLEYLKDKIMTTQPLKGDIDPTKAGFFAEQYGGDGTTFAESLEGRTAWKALDTGLTSLQGEAGKVTGAMQNVYGGSGIGMRAGIAGQKALGTGFETAYEGYGLTKDTADLDYRKGIYGLEEDVTGQWESDWSTFWSGLPDAGGN